MQPRPLHELWIGNPDALIRTLVIGVFAYAGLVAILRISGKRTLAKLNAFDLVVTVALGSTLATILLDDAIALAQGLLAIALLVALQFGITWSSVRWPWVRQLVTGDPRLLAYRGQPLPEALRRTRVTEDELRTAARSAGCANLGETAAIVLETDGSLSVITDLGPGGLAGIASPDRPRE